MDKVFISGLSIQTTIGFYQWEKEIKQTLVFDLELGWYIKPAAENDELDKTLDYAGISIEIERFANENPVDLLETLAHRTAEHLMHKYGIEWLRMKLHKPHAVHNAQSVGVEIERTMASIT
ncbi:dihydroneopterin aldolase [Thalassotalea sp. LPB0316]|uniref:dihydroneopterin aldolase n=1 Tax=Thalassotalea sp. LPB0316 TaxID=2769490 RepID=UPI00186822AE|nr:dihydroneopterin aldolase [Thalassotalea sp. LPB0316]QOL25788.1 dihydroneopterin aldolase [Thalassotalea sp. LPB0316]